MIGLPFTPMFITEIAVLTEAMASMPIVVVGLLASMLLLTIGVLHTLQDHVFKKSRIKNLSIPLSLSSHCIYIMLIIFNIVKGVMPTWLIGLLYRGAHYR